MAREIFAPAYSVVAGQIKEKTGITEGVCVDLGSGGGYLGLELAKITALTVHLLDMRPAMHGIAEKNIAEYGLAERVTSVVGNVHELPFEDGSLDLVVSRGSIFFWEDLAAALREIYRVLKSGGKTFLGGGFGTPQLFAQIAEKMEVIDPTWKDSVKKRLGRTTLEHFTAMLAEAGVSDYSIEQSDIELWIIIKKETSLQDKMKI